MFEKVREGQGNERRAIWPSERKSAVDAFKEHNGEEGRGKLRKAWGKSTHLLIPWYPNGVTPVSRGTDCERERK